MATVRCHHCDKEMFTIIGWQDVDRCSNCGRPLGERIDGVSAVINTKRRVIAEMTAYRREPRETATP